MEKPTKLVLLLALFLGTFVVSLEGRDIKGKPNTYHVEATPSANGGYFGFPGSGGGSGVGPGFSFGSPLFGGIPKFGNMPTVPGLGLPRGGTGKKPGVSKP